MITSTSQSRCLAVFFALLTLISFVWAKDATPAHYVVPSEIDFTKILPSIAAVTDPQAKVEKDFELSVVIETQKEASAADVQRARDEARTPDHMPSPFSFSDVIGPWFKADNANISLTVALLKNALDDAEGVIRPAKKNWNRTRPFRQDPADIKLQTDDPGEVPGPTSASYPSGHATDGMVFALVLSDLAPELKDKLIARGVQYGNDRVILGVHFPSDVAAGRVLAQAIYTALKDKKSYQNDLAAAKVQFQKELLVHAGQSGAVSK
ncbi:MAG: phosphatase PAP2 family protein [Methylacidiphilales bacterium]|nr:phosphatase PAP2 family protein [Candidatus Methylacidiphilales bacterium]